MSYSYLLLRLLCTISLQRRLLYESIVEDSDMLICHLLVNIFNNPMFYARRYNCVSFYSVDNASGYY